MQVCAQPPHNCSGMATHLAKALLTWTSENGRMFPWRVEPRDPWRVLLSEILLRQTSSGHVAPLYELILELVPNPAALRDMPAERLAGTMRPLGLYEQRAAGLKDLGEALIQRHNGRIPRSLRTLLALPHVGPYAAGAVLVFAYGKRAPLPDVNVSRLGSRYYGVPFPNTPAQRMLVAKRVLRACPKGREPEFYYGLLDLAATACRSRPRCNTCPLSAKCKHVQSTRVRLPRE